MTIVIDEQDLPEDLTVLEYVILFFLFNQKSIDVFPQQLEYLEDKKYVKLTDSIELREKALKLFTKEEDKNMIKFLEVFNGYPIKTYTGRRLRPKDLNAKESQELFKKYITKVIDKGKHNYVKQCLDNELIERRKANNLDYMHEMITWINGEKWDRYSSEDIISSEERFESI